jgi:hypothetical protein
VNFIKRTIVPNLAEITRQWFGVLWLYLASLAWHRMAAGELSFIVAAWLLSLFVGSYLAGDLLLKWIVRDAERFNSQSIRLLTGMLCVGLLLFLAVLFLPFRLAVVWIIILSGILSIWLRASFRQKSTACKGLERSEGFFLLILPIAITAWCWDILHPIEADGDLIVIRAWEDIYFHLCQITAFASSHGIASISDVQMSGAPIHPYHFATYLIPAALVDVTGSSSLVAYASLLVPLSILVTALAAYSLARVVFGSWPAMAAGLALMLLPDSFQQGFGNPYFGYHWLQQIAPGQGYGLAAGGLAFMFLFEAYRQGQYRLVTLGYACVLVCMTYKAQIFVAISFTALIFPILFMPGKLERFRLPALLAASIFYVVVISVSQASPAIPTMRLDGSGFKSFFSTILSLQTDGYIKRYLLALANQSMNIWFAGAVSFALILIPLTFGAFSLLYLFLAGSLKRAFGAPAQMFPWLVFAVYLVMATGLALDERKLGTPDELLHRPFVWAYFVMVIWCAGASYHRFFGDAAPSNKHVRRILALGVAVLISVPIDFGRGIETMKWGGTGFPRLPACQLAVTTFIREHSDAHDIVQDSSNGPHFILSALSERREFAIDTGGVRAPPGVKSRVEALLSIKSTSDRAEVARFMQSNAIKWYVVDRSDRVQWADDAAITPTFECGGDRVYGF